MDTVEEQVTHIPPPYCVGASGEILTADKRIHVATVYPTNVGDEEHAEVIASGIVHACNCHDDLVVALQWVVGDYVCKGHDNDPEDCPFCYARAILAKVEKGN